MPSSLLSLAVPCPVLLALWPWVLLDCYFTFGFFAPCWALFLALDYVLGGRWSVGLVALSRLAHFIGLS